MSKDIKMVLIVAAGVALWGGVANALRDNDIVGKIINGFDK